MSYTDDNLEDRYGSYYLLTGHEEKGHCFWCGATVTRGRRYCCKEHQEKYHMYFFWPDARAWALQRAGGHCQSCGQKRSLVVHHIEPLNGAPRNWNALNRPSNLIALCRICHGKAHSKPEAPEDKLQAMLDAGQMPMFDERDIRDG